MCSTESSRRGFLKAVGTTGPGIAASSISPCTNAAERKDNTTQEPRGTIRVAAVQMRPRLGDVSANLDIAHNLVRKVFEQDAKWVVLPEFFTSGLMMDPKIYEAHRPVDGEPMNFLRELAREGNAVVGGSYLAKSGENVYNTFALADPHGTTYTHDKDFPSLWVESTFYAGGEDEEYLAALVEHGAIDRAHQYRPIASRPGSQKDGVFTILGVRVGAILCWEMIRNRTATRLLNNVDLVLAGSCWSWSHADYGFPTRGSEELKRNWDLQKRLIREAPRRLARTLGVPVVHANMIGDNPGYSSVDFNDDEKVKLRYLGESQIVDARGKKKGIRADGEGVVVADVTLAASESSHEIADGFWIPEMPAEFGKLWADTGAKGREQYLRIARPTYNQTK
jgi:predicted amidohydrolase